jgi:hypothetical protein
VKPQAMILPIYKGCGRLCKTDSKPCPCGHNCQRLTAKELRERELPKCGGRHDVGARRPV